MKIKADFVTNSSSTSFTFIFRGNSILDLFEKMRKYKNKFEIEYEYPEYCDEYMNGPIKINVEDIISSIEEGIAKNNKYYEKDDIDYVRIGDIEALEERIIPNLDYCLKEVADNIVNNKRTPQYVFDEINTFNNQLDILEKAKKKNMKSLVIGFGDNHGEVCGTPVAFAMDYEGRNIKIDKPDLIVYTEQNR